MKKMKCLSLLLSLAVAMQCFALPAGAVEGFETLPATEPSVSESAEDSFTTAEIPFGSVCIQEGCRTIEAMNPLAGSDRRVATAKSVFVYEMNTDTVIYSNNPDLSVNPGTLVKIVTALVAIENCDLNDIVTCAEGIQSKIPYGSQNVKLKSGEQLTLEELLYCMLLQGANDAAVAIAEHVGGTTTRFREMMNERVAEIGCTATNFGNISGLTTAANYSTARDMARIVAEASKNEKFMNIFGASEYTVPATNMSDEREFQTTNYMLQNKIVTKFIYKGVTGGYQSCIDDVDASLACTAERNGMKLVCIVMNATRTYHPDGWPVESYGNFEEMLDIMEFVFGGYKVAQVLYEGQALEQFNVAGGECDVVGTPGTTISSVLPMDAHMNNLIIDADTGGELSAPVKKGDQIATVSVWYRNSCLMETELYAMNDVKLAEEAAEIQSNEVQNSEGMSKAMSIVGTVCVIILGCFGVYLLYGNVRRAIIRRQRRRRRTNRRRSY